MLAEVGLAAYSLGSAQRLADWFRDCEHIEIGQIESLEPMGGIEGVRIAELRVERSLWTADCADTWNLLVQDAGHPDGQRLVVGDRSIWFLARMWHHREEFDWEADRALFEIEMHRRLQRVIAWLPLETGHGQTFVVLQSSGPTPPSNPTSVRGRSGRDISLESFEADLWREIRRSTPQIESKGYLTIERDGTVSFLRQTSSEGMILAPWEMSSLLATIEREGFFELPRSVGIACCPDSTSSVLAVRSCQGRHEVFLNGKPNQASVRDIDAYGRIRRIWDAIPSSMLERLMEKRRWR